jgi:dihydroflavonol-4-reductase
VAHVFLKDGSFCVRGTVRDLSNAKKIEPLRKAFGQYFENLTLVEADLLNADSVINSIKGADFVVHTASPFPLKQPSDEM